MKEFKIEVTYRCDLNCIHCSSDAHPSNTSEMQLSDCIRILDQASAMGGREVAFSGGEPFGWPNLIEAAAFAIQHKLRVTVYTSGNAVDFATKADSLKCAGVDRLVFSVFGANSISHERITRVAGSFDKTAVAIKVAKAIGLKPEVHFVPMSVNYSELPDLTAIAQEWGVSTVSVLRLVPQGRGALLRSRILNRVQNLRLRQIILSLRKQGFTVRTGSPYNFLMVNEKPGCWAAIDRLVIGPDMKVYPCDAFKRIGSEELVGTDDWSNLCETSMQDCWQKSPYLQAVRQFLMTDFTDPCASCGFLDRCVSGCLAQKTLAEGTLRKCPDPDCLCLSRTEGLP
jgi:radical SAM protein with 4Fe4S-binding SPASM domain